MFTCSDCHSEDSHVEYVSEIFNIDGKFYLVENIPAEVCDRCREEVFSAETTEQVRLMMHGEVTPTKSITLDVFSYKAAS